LLEIIYWTPPEVIDDIRKLRPPLNKDVIEAAKNLVMMDLALLQAEAAAGMYKKPIELLAKEVHYEPLPQEIRVAIIAAWTRGSTLPQATIEAVVPRELEVTMADKNQSTGDGQARSLSNLRVTYSHLDSDYEVQTHDLTRGETGLLRVFSLVPKMAGKPSFEARVDDGSSGKRRDPELDIGIEGVSAVISSDFKAGRNGYIGHHTDSKSNTRPADFRC
jgi:hypothetical protein